LTEKHLKYNLARELVKIQISYGGKAYLEKAKEGIDYNTLLKISRPIGNKTGKMFGVNIWFRKVESNQKS